MNRKIKRHFLQSHDWAIFQEKLGNAVYERSGPGWQYLAVLEKSYGRVGRFFSRLYLPYGPTFDSEEAFVRAIDDLNKLALDVHVDYIRIEPQAADVAVDLNYADYGFKKINQASQPDLTLLIDLSRSWDEVLADISKTNRYDYNKANRRGLEYQITYLNSEIEPFVLMMKETGERAKAIFHSKEYFMKLMETLGPNKHGGIAYALYDNQPIVGIFFFDDLETKTRYYAHAGSLNKARELKINANAALVVHLIKDAKEKGLEVFDFFGIAPVDAPDSHRWAGFSRFKRSFGGQDYKYSGTWEKPVKSLKYALLGLLRRFI